MKAMSMHLLVTVVWTFLHGQTTMGGFFLGSIASFFMLWALEGVLHCEDYVRRVRALISFLVHFFYSMVKSNFEMGVLSLSWNLSGKKGGFTRYNVEDLTSLERSLLAQFINLTPGTTVADLTSDHHFILHSFPQVSEAALNERINQTLKERLLAITRAAEMKEVSEHD